MATATRAAARPRPDAVLTAAVDLARAAAQDVADRDAFVGEHAGSTLVSERLVEHRFECTMPGYRGWFWTVTLARAPRAKAATVCEVELLPGTDAILSPAWLPWSERLRPGDVGPGDVLPFRADDPRLEPGYTPTGDEEMDAVAIGELALARARVLSHDGIEEAAQRWYDGAAGPRSPHAVASSADCLTCGFIVPLQGELGQVFGVCTNPWSQDDGRVVAFDHGCGAHSETDVPPHPSDWPAPAPIIDELSLEIVATQPAAAVDAGSPAAADAVAPAADVVAPDPSLAPGADANAPAAEAAQGADAAEVSDADAAEGSDADAAAEGSDASVGQEPATAGEPVEVPSAAPKGAEDVEQPAEVAAADATTVADLTADATTDADASADADSVADAAADAADASAGAEGTTTE